MFPLDTAVICPRVRLFHAVTACNGSVRHSSPGMKSYMISFTFWKLTADPFPVLIQNHYFSHQTLFMKFNGLQHYQKLRDLCQQVVVSLSCRPAVLDSYLLACLHDYKWEDSPSKAAYSRATRPFLVPKESAPLFLHQQRTSVFTLEPNFSENYDLPDTTEQNHPQHERAHSVVEKADLNQTTTQINN